MLGQRLTVVTAAEPVPPPLDDRQTRRRFGPDGDVEAFLDELVGPLREEGVAVDARVIYDPISPAEGVRSHLRDEPAALVVVSSHARTGLTRLVFGSTAAAIVHHSPSPVLVVPRPDAR
jgi:nucleotide-binding universal stress UspA family protein